MTPQIVILLFWLVVIFVVWRVMRSRFFREACEDLEAMYKAPENKGGPEGFQPHMGVGTSEKTVKPVRNGEER